MRRKSEMCSVVCGTGEPRLSEVAGDRPNLFVKSEGLLYRKPRYNEREGKRPKSSLYRGHS